MNGRSKGLVLLAWLANVAAVGAVVWVGYDGWRRLFALRPGAEPVAEPARRPPPRDKVDIRTIVNAHLFGRAAAVVRTPPAPVVAPPTRLNLHLVGIVAAADGSRGRALVEVGRGRHEVLAVGQRIGDTDAILDAIRPDHVLIKRNGEIERLAPERPQLGDDAPGNVRGLTADGERARTLERLREEDAARLAALAGDSEDGAGRRQGAGHTTLADRLATMIAERRQRRQQQAADGKIVDEPPAPETAANGDPAAPGQTEDAAHGAGAPGGTRMKLPF